MCCISLACNIHRYTSRMVDTCSYKIQRGTCAKNTVHFLKNDPHLTCPRCTVDIVHCAVPIRSERLSRDNEESLATEVRDGVDVERSWTHDDVMQPALPSQLQVPCLSPLRSSRPASAHISDFQLPTIHARPDDNADLTELSHEDGIHLIDEMYGGGDVGRPDQTVDAMDTSDDNEMHHILPEPCDDLEESHNNMINETMQRSDNNNESAIAAGASSLSLLQKYRATLADVSVQNQTHTEAKMLEARTFLHRAQQELDKLRHTEWELESEFLWCLRGYVITTPPTQMSANGGL